ncbi:MAG TPA: ADOP family duplicated permease [Gemmatimonadales bacterium]|jgi:predicted permease|nr:ADOP family duplicated permease [Gemmatimonadales bacterium]
MRVRLNQQRLLAFLAQSPLSQNHWAIKLGLSRGHWSEIVNGKHPYPSPKTRERMLEVLGLPFDELFEIETGIPSWADTDFRRAIADRYLIDTELGQGGMGAVYLARDTRHGRTVAVKVISPEAVSGIGITQFLREIATVAQLQHPHILPLHDSGEAAGQPFYVMPYIRGGSLRARLQSAIRLPGEEAVVLITGIAAALQYAHEQRVLHCDVKPENILLDGTHPYVMDFGVARKLHTEVLPWTLRRELDFSAGTPAYVSPEQASGEKELDTRSDVYSLACVVYEMLSGRPPFEGPTTQAIVSSRFIAPPPSLREFAPELSPLLDRAVERGMALEPRQRPATPAEFSAAVIAAARPASGGLARLSIAVTRGMSRLRSRRSTPRLGRFGMESVGQNLRYALRGLRRSPAFTLVAVLTLALGIGANTAIFSVVRGLLLKPLPHRDGDRLMYLRHSADGPGRANVTFSVPEVKDFRARAATLGGGIAEYSTTSGILQREDGASRISLGLVTGNFFDVMGLSPILGRLTRASDDGRGVPAVMVLTRECWLSRFGGDSATVGRQIRMDDRSVTVIGVVQPAPSFPTRVDAYTNMVVSDHHLSAFMTESRTHRMTEVVARLAPGATLEQARSEVGTVYATMQRDFAAAYDPGSHYRVAMMPLKEVLGERAKLTLWLLMGAAGFVLIISAANVANLTLMRGIRRAHELVTRAALGAGVGRLRRLLLAENVLLALLGGGLGFLIAIGGLGLLTSFAARYSPRASEIGLDPVVLGFTLAVSLGLAFLLSFVATLPEEGALAAWISAGGTRNTGDRRKHRLQRGLVVVQVAVSVMLLTGAGLLTRTLIRLSEVESGLTTEDVLSLNVPLLTRGRSDSVAEAAARSAYQQMRIEIAALPGVIEVGQGSAPLRSTDIWADVRAENRPLPPGQGYPNVELRFASAGYFRAAGIPILSGREFVATDQGGFGGATIVNQALADRLFPGENPIGQRIARFDVVRFVWGGWNTIVGVVGNTRDGGLDADPRPAMFVDLGRGVASELVIRAERNIANLIPTVTAIIRRIAPTAPVERVATITQLRDESVAPRRLNTTLIASFSLLALVIAAVGIAGVLAFSVSARTNEIGIRMSLGADTGQVQRMILGEGGLLLALGLGLGIAGASVSAGVIRGLLFGVAPHDPVTFVGVAATMAAIGIVACWIPALRAARVDPAIAMRSE